MALLNSLAKTSDSDRKRATIFGKKLQETRHAEISEAIGCYVFTREVRVRRATMVCRQAKVMDFVREGFSEGKRGIFNASRSKAANVTFHAE